MDQPAVQALESFGFSSYEARAYLALQAEAPVTGYQLSKNAGVPRSRIYDTLERLQNKGYAIRIEGDPATYAALSPTGLLSRLRADVRQSLQAIEAFTADADQGEDFLHIRGADEVQAWIEMLIQGAVRTIEISSDRPLTDRQLLELRAALERRVDVILHSPNAAAGGHGIRHYAWLQSAGNPGSFQVLVDGEAILAGAADRATWSRSPEMVHWIEESIHLRIARDEVLRRIGRRAAQVYTEIEKELSTAGPPQPTPRREQPAGLSIRPTLRPFPGFRTGEAIIEPVR